VPDYLSTLMYHSGNSARELTLALPAALPPLPSHALRRTSRNRLVFRWLQEPPRRWRAGNSRNFTFGSYESAALCGSSSAEPRQAEIIPDEFLRICAAELKRSRVTRWEGGEGGGGTCARARARLTRRRLRREPEPREVEGAAELTGAIFTRVAISRTEVYRRRRGAAYVTAKLCR